ncbi:mannose-1-phosphate guanylyltransferase/mannose-6-phosphate isomerase [Ramlibacter aquaticus]|uniref:mannose-1-phosphate guanylyltransferase n=1 Tax=Ramlibacter aquaticus TaxID=2780094 RepID=A0ABR9SJY3_9BURK|nr:mannose-1-phosphate guanylyltransferase/mannose-6-phosphate isomerase [Ramlibacter aquaticus]MBE7942681.1 mannose-1-phosphate guanylyltransferase/mannose-6-phosphate isomerase [Ramlibacter aquaticus]
MAALIPVVLCGGAGTRLWPVSRELHPKPFMRLPDGKTLLQQTFDRAAGLPQVGRIMTVTNREFFFRTREEYESTRANAVAASYLLEPQGRNTAAAVALATLRVEQLEGPDAVMLVMPADHVITNADAFAKAVGQAIVLALAGRICTFGIRPTQPETGYGYIEHSDQDVVAFVEKPDRITAQRYMGSGRHLWNAGMFCFRAGTMLQELEQLCPEILEGCRAALVTARHAELPRGEQLEFAGEKFASIRSDSIDFAVMERTALAAVIPCDNIGWSDIGSWSALSELSLADSSGNRVDGETVVHDSRNCFVHSERVVAIVGVEDLVIVDTPDALLVAHRDRAQDVKHVFSQLKAKDHESHKLHRTVHRPWGTYSVLEEARSFKIKRIEVRPGAALSLQMHHHRSEHWIVVSGIAEVLNGEELITLKSNESTYIPAGHKHRLRNPGRIDLVMIEVQSGEYLGEDDILRFEDNYGRA